MGHFHLDRRRTSLGIERMRQRSKTSQRLFKTFATLAKDCDYCETCENRQTQYK